MSIQKPIPHPSLTEVKIIENKNNFPIRWLNKQSYCEYTNIIVNFKGFKVSPTKETK
jgi:hypothetical protein